MSPEFISVTMTLAGGFIMTIKIFALTLLFALPLGLVICFGSMSKFSPLRYLVKFFVWVIRGTPLMLQLMALSPYFMFPVLSVNGRRAHKLTMRL